MLLLHYPSPCDGFPAVLELHVSNITGVPLGGVELTGRPLDSVLVLQTVWHAA